MKKLTLIYFLITTIVLVEAQANQVPTTSKEQSFLWPYTLPDKDNTGPMDVLVSGVYTITREKWGDRVQANIQYRITSMIFSNRHGDYRFRYNGKIYNLREVDAIDGLNIMGYKEIKIVGVDIKIKANGLKNATQFTLDSNLTGNVNIGEMGENQNPNSVNLELVGSYATGIFYDYETTLTSRINNAIKLTDKRKDYKQYIADADRYFNSKNWSEAKAAYKNANEVFPKEIYPPAQIAKIEAIEKKEAEKVEAKKVAEATDAKKAEQRKTTEVPVNQVTGAGKGKINTNTTNGVMPNNRLPSSNNNSASTDDTGSGQLSEKVKINVGGKQSEVQVFKQSGKYYVVNADGTQHETTQQAYNKVQEASNKKISNAENKAKAEAVALSKYTADQDAKRAAHDLQQAKALQKAERNAFVGQQLYSSFYAAQVAINSKAKLDSNSQLSGSYDSKEQLEEEFNFKYNSISSDVQEWTDAKNESLYAASSILTSSGDTTTQVIGLGASLIGGLINQGNAEKEERERKAELKRQRDAHLASMEAKRKAALVDLRIKLLSQYPEGGIPISAHRVTIPEVYFFAYHFDKATIESNQPAITITEVFPLSKYSDDTWPYKNAILKELKQKMGKTDNVTLMGYYATKKLAEEMRTALIELSPKANFQVLEVVYKGKPKSGEDSGDFWGDESKTETSKNKENKTEDFWGNPVKKTEKKSPVKDIKEQDDSKTTTAELDFWGNPVKQK